MTDQQVTALAAAAKELPEPAVATGQEAFADLAGAFAALETLVADLLEIENPDAGRPDEVVAYVYDANGPRAGELSASWTGDPARGDAFKSRGVSWMRSDPGCAAVLLAAEDVILYHGAEPDYHRGEIIRDEENEARWRLAFNLSGGKEPSPEAIKKINLARDDDTDFPGIPSEDADAYEAEVLADETDGIPD